MTIIVIFLVILVSQASTSTTAFVVSARESSFRIRKNSNNNNNAKRSNSENQYWYCGHVDCHAKKKRQTKSGGSSSKKGGFAWASSFTLAPYDAKATRELATIAVASFKARSGGGTGQTLSPSLEKAIDIPKALWNAPDVACVIVKEGEDASATVVQYANIAALETVGLDANEFEKLFSTKPPSPRRAAQEHNENDGDTTTVEATLTTTSSSSTSTMISLDLPPTMKGDKKFERDYKKKILKKQLQNAQDDADNNENQDDVMILNAFRWELQKNAIVDGTFVTEAIGVAYAWSEWRLGDTWLCRPGGIRQQVERIPDNLNDRILQQGDIVRHLKESQGLGNKDPQVMAAVAELLRLKALKETTSTTTKTTST